MSHQHIDLSRARWKKSRHSQQNGACVEVAYNLPSVIAVRDSKDTGGLALAFTPEGWDAFIGDLTNGAPTSGAGRR